MLFQATGWSAPAFGPRARVEFQRICASLKPAAFKQQAEMILMSFSIKSFDQIIRDGFKRNSKRNLEVGGWGVGGGKQACFTMHQISEKCCYDPLRSLSQSLVCENNIERGNSVMGRTTIYRHRLTVSLRYSCLDFTCC